MSTQESTAVEKPVKAEIFQAALLLKLIKRMDSIEKLTRSMVEEGIIEPLSPRTVTTRPIVLRPPISTKPWFGVKISNDGPSSVWVVLNTEKTSQSQEIKDGETWGADFKTAVIEDIYLYTETSTATVRVRGER